jgi:hypothetical protein
MRLTTGIVRRGTVELDDDKDLPDGTPVMVIAQEGDETFELSQEEEEKLLAAIREVELGHVQDGQEVLRKIRRK